MEIGIDSFAPSYGAGSVIAGVILFLIKGKTTN